VFAIWKDGFMGEESFFRFQEEGIQNILIAISTILWLTGSLFVTFSEEKYEDEFIARTRMESLVWGTYLNDTFFWFIFSIFFGRSIFPTKHFLSSPILYFSILLYSL
jgi:hypothetical protein